MLDTSKLGGLSRFELTERCEKLRAGYILAFEKSEGLKPNSF
jgi:hypothetical protein